MSERLSGAIFQRHAYSLIMSQNPKLVKTRYNGIMTITKNKKTILAAIFGIVFVLLLTLTIIFIAKHNNLSDFERLTFERETEKTINYLEAIDNDFETNEPQQADKYLAFALLQSYGENNVSVLNAEDIQQIIQSNFDIEIDLHYIEAAAITPTINYFRISKNREDNYTLDTERSAKDIANAPIFKYLLKDVTKTKNGFKATYAKYRADDPYKIFNYASDHKIDVPGAGAYLSGKGSSAPLKNVITLENAEELATFEKDIKIDFVIRDDKLLLKSIN